MADNRLRCTSPAPEGCKKRFEKTRSRMVYHAIWGLGEITPTSRIVSNDITMPRLPFYKHYANTVRKGRKESDKDTQINTAMNKCSGEVVMLDLSTVVILFLVPTDQRQVLKRILQALFQRRHTTS